jgi:uncharacterized membrane protein YhaH (DUF805 family)
MTFGQAISTCFGKFATLKGRAGRSEFWWFYLFSALTSWGFSIAIGATIGSMAALGANDAELGGAAIGMYLSYFMIAAVIGTPVWAASVRRLHDTGHSGWTLLLYFTCIGMIPIFIWLVSESNPEKNQYGPNPSSVDE